MKLPDRTAKPGIQEQEMATSTLKQLTRLLKKLDSETTQIELLELGEKIELPVQALRILATYLEYTSKGKPVALIPVPTELTTQAAADLIGCSRPHLIKLLDKEEIPFTKVGKHRRVKLEDVVEYKKKLKARQKKYLSKIMSADEADGLYDS